MKVGISYKSYAEHRNIIDLPYNDVEVVRIVDFFRIYTHFYNKSFTRNYMLRKNLFFDFGINDTDINCFFNGISLSKTPWVTIFETLLPRFGDASRFWYKVGLKRLAGNSCKKIVALSECAYNIQSRYLKNNYPEYYDEIKNKMIVLHPAQRKLIGDYSEKRTSSDHIVFTFVGNDFFRKGGREILYVFNELIPTYPNIKVYIVSSMQYGDYASCATKKDLEDAMKIIDKYPNNIYQYSNLPNENVLELLIKTDVGLLPSWADTFGYSLLEAQAAGCPVISTDIRAFPEINNDKCGWLIKVDKNEKCEPCLESESERKKFSLNLRHELYNVIKTILCDTKIIKIKGKLALDRITQEHDPKIAALKLEHVFNKSLK